MQNTLREVKFLRVASGGNVDLVGFDQGPSGGYITLGSSGFPDAAATYFNRREKLFLLASAPPTKFVLGFDYQLKGFNATLRFNRFGKVVLEDWLGRDHVYTPKITTDLTFGYDFGRTSLHIGATNLFNLFPDSQNIETEGGGLYDSVQMGIAGGFGFVRLGFKL